MGNREKYARAFEALDSPRAAREFLGDACDALEFHVRRVMLPDEAKQSPAPSNPPSESMLRLARAVARNQALRDARREELMGRARQARRTARGLSTELARLAVYLEELEARIDEDLRGDPLAVSETEPALSALDMLSRRMRYGIPLRMPMASELRTLIASLVGFAERVGGAAPKRMRGKATKRRLPVIEPFNLTLALLALEEENVSKVEPKQLAAAEVLVTGKPQRTIDRAANACRKWERLLSRARRDLPAMRELLAESRVEATPAK